MSSEPAVFEFEITADEDLEVEIEITPMISHSNGGECLDEPQGNSGRNTPSFLPSNPPPPEEPEA